MKGRDLFGNNNWMNNNFTAKLQNQRGPDLHKTREPIVLRQEARHLETARRQEEVRHQHMEKMHRQQEQQAQKQQTVYTNNCHGMIDYSPFVPTDTLNVKVSENLRRACIESIEPALQREILLPVYKISDAFMKDAANGVPSIESSITGHGGDTFGHWEFPS